VTTSLKTTLEDLLKRHRLQSEGPPLATVEGNRPLATGIRALDGLLAGGFARGEVSEVYGPPSSGRTGLALCLVARAIRRGALVAWVDPGDRLDPHSAASLNLDLSRLLWLRGEPRVSGLAKALSAVGALMGSGLFEIVVLDLAGIPREEILRLPGATWIRLQRMVETRPAVLLLLSSTHIVRSPGGASLSLTPLAPRWSAHPGPGRLLRGLVAEARVGLHAGRSVLFELRDSAWGR